MCDFSVGLSRQLHGLTIASERRRHRMLEQWHPLGPIGIITAFNFPAAVWAWNAMIAAVCGDTMIWKPSPLAALTAVAIQRIAGRVAADGRLPGRVQPLRRRRRGDRRANGQGRPAAFDFGDRKLPDGPSRCRGGGQAAGTDTPGTGWQQCHHRHSQRGRRDGRTRHRLRGGGHCRPAVHDSPTIDRARITSRCLSRTVDRGLPQPADR